MLLRKIVFARLYLLTLFEGVLTAACYTAATYIHMPLQASVYLEYEDGAARIALVSVVFVIASYVFDFYKRVYARVRMVLALQMCELMAIMLLVQSGIGFINPELILPQGIVLTGSALTLVVFVLWRLFLYPHVWNAFGAQRVVFVGCNRAAQWLARTFDTQVTLGIQVSGFLIDDEAPQCPGPVLGRQEALESIVRKIKPDRIIVSEDSTDKKLLRTLFRLKSSGFNVETAGHAYELLYGRIFSASLQPGDLVFRNDLAARPGSLALQSIYTNLLALATTIVVLPVVILIGIAIRLAGAPRMMVRIPCAGLHGIPFNMYRFCCSGRLGRLLTRFRLAGLPQAINILRGEMTLIGPRAESLPFDAELASLIPFYVQRHHVKPGIIGWSQLHCDTSDSEAADTIARVEYDLYYIKHLSLTLDAYIAIRALKWLIAQRDSAIAVSDVPLSHEAAYSPQSRT
jgi:lipopolysaccharide/colanic/teichoic acid biosynthesis glycosyltransferase